MDGNNSININISGKAIEQFLKIMADNGIGENYFLRISVEGNKHSGISYPLGFDSHPKDSDIIITLSELKLLIDSNSAPLLEGCSIDYNEEGCCGGFVFNNPNAVNKCGCRN